MNEKEVILQGLELYIARMNTILFEVIRADRSSDAALKIREKRDFAQSLVKKYQAKDIEHESDPVDSLDNAVIKIDGDKIEITIVDGFEISPGDFRFAIFGGGDQKKSGESNSDALSRIIKRIHAEVAAVEGAE